MLNTPPKVKRSKFVIRYSTRTMFVVMSLVGLILGLHVVPELQQISKERKATQWLTTVNGRIVSRHGVGDTGFVRRVSSFESARIVDFFDPEPVDITPIGEFTKLEKLSFYETQISDVSALARLSELKELEIRVRYIPEYNEEGYLVSTRPEKIQKLDLAPLARLKKLEELDLFNAKILNLDPLADLTNIHYLRLDNTDTSDVSPLTNLTNLRELFLGDTPVENIKPLAGLSKLEELNLAWTQIDDIAPLAELKSLRTLNIDGTEIEDLFPLENLPVIYRLTFDNTLVTDVSPIVRMRRIGSVSMVNTRVKNLTVLGNAKSLKEIAVGLGDYPDESLQQLKVAKPDLKIWVLKTENQRLKERTLFGGG